MAIRNVIVSFYMWRAKTAVEIEAAAEAAAPGQPSGLTLVIRCATTAYLALTPPDAAGAFLVSDHRGSGISPDLGPEAVSGPPGG